MDGNPLAIRGDRDARVAQFAVAIPYIKVQPGSLVASSGRLCILENHLQLDSSPQKLNGHGMRIRHRARADRALNTWHTKEPMMPTARAVLAGGCFWGVQDLVRKLPGVVSSRVGYSGGDVANATYRNHGTHAEAVEIIFDPEKISYRDLLEFFFQIHDPSTRNRQGNDMGASYRSAIYYTNDEQRRVAEDTIADVDASGLWPGKVVTTIEPVGPFWEAEAEHQDYLVRIPDGYTCHFVRPNWKLPRRSAVA